MAKIYETQEDVERERLCQKAKAESDSQDKFILVGAPLVALGISDLQLHSLTRFKSKIVKEELTFLDKLHKPFGWATLFVGLGAFVLAFKARTDSKKTKEELEHFTPQEVILPNGRSVTSGRGENVSRLEKSRESYGATKSITWP